MLTSRPRRRWAWARDWEVRLNADWYIFFVSSWLGTEHVHAGAMGAVLQSPTSLSGLRTGVALLIPRRVAVDVFLSGGGFSSPVARDASVATARVAARGVSATRIDSHGDCRCPTVTRSFTVRVLMRVRAHFSADIREVPAWLFSKRHLCDMIFFSNGQRTGWSRGIGENEIEKRDTRRPSSASSPIPSQSTEAGSPAARWHPIAAPLHSMVNCSGVSVALCVKLTGSPVAAADTPFTAILANV